MASTKKKIQTTTLNWDNVDVNKITVDLMEDNKGGGRFHIRYEDNHLVVIAPTVFATGMELSKHAEGKMVMPHMTMYFENRDGKITNNCKSFLKKHDEIIARIQQLITEQGFDTLSFASFDPMRRKPKKEGIKVMKNEDGEIMYHPRSIFCKLAGYVKCEKDRNQKRIEETASREIWGKLYDKKTRSAMRWEELAPNEQSPFSKHCNVLPWLAYDDAYFDTKAIIYLQIKLKQAVIEIRERSEIDNNPLWGEVDNHWENGVGEKEEEEDKLSVVSTDSDSS